jgi:hypothetical protein
MLGLTDRVDPVQASNALRWASFQSVVPSSCRIAKEVRGDFVVMRALMGVVDVIFWYKKGMPTRALRTGERIRRLETVLSGVPERPTKEPRRVWRSCEGDSETERREYGDPSTSNVASAHGVRLVFPQLELRHDRPGDDADSDLLPTEILLLSVEGVACIVMFLMPLILLPQTMCAGRSHRLV